MSQITARHRRHFWPFFFDASCSVNFQVWGLDSQGRNGMDRALCDTILKFGMMLGLGKGFSKTTGYKLAEHPGGR